MTTLKRLLDGLRKEPHIVSGDSARLMGRMPYLDKFDNAMLQVGAVKGNEVNETSHTIQAAELRVQAAEEAVLAAQTALENAKRAREEAEQDQAVLDRYEHDIELARATSVLLRCMRSHDFREVAFPAINGDWSATLAKSRDELLPLAASYGFDIVLIADDTRAELRKTYRV